MNFNPTILYTVIRSLAALLTGFGLAQFSEADVEIVIGAAASVYAAVDVTIKAFQAKRGQL